MRRTFCGCELLALLAGAHARLGHACGRVVFSPRGNVVSCERLDLPSRPDSAEFQIINGLVNVVVLTRSLQGDKIG